MSSFVTLMSADGNKAIDENYSFYQREKAEDYADLLASVRRSKVY